MFRACTGFVLPLHASRSQADFAFVHLPNCQHRSAGQGVVVLVAGHVQAALRYASTCLLSLQLLCIQGPFGSEEMRLGRSLRSAVRADTGVKDGATPLPVAAAMSPEGRRL